MVECEYARADAQTGRATVRHPQGDSGPSPKACLLRADSPPTGAPCDATTRTADANPSRAGAKEAHVANVKRSCQN